MTLRTFGHIVAMQNQSSQSFALHSRNMQVARLDSAAWQTIDLLARSQPLPESLRDSKRELEEWNDSVSSDAADEQIPEGIRSLSVNTTQICNLRCVYCGASGDGTYGSEKRQVELDPLLAQIEHFLALVPAGQAFTLRFLGGEPLLYPSGVRAAADFAQLRARELNVQLHLKITTNGTQITPEIAEMLAEFGFGVTLSLDGPPEIQDRARPTAGARASSPAVARGLKALLSVRERLSGLSVNSVFGAHHRDVRATYYFLRELSPEQGFDQINFIWAAEADDAQFNQEYIENFCDLADELFTQGGETALCQLAQFQRSFAALDQQMRVHNHCRAGKTLIQADTKNILYACNWFMDAEKNSVGRNQEIDPTRRAHYQKSLIELNQCDQCWARFFCGGGCMFVNRVKSGDQHRKDDAFCQRERALLAKAIELYALARETEDLSVQDTESQNAIS